MDQRPELNKELSCDSFLKNYYLKEELTWFLRESGLSTTGNKKELTSRIALFLKSGIILTENTDKKKGIVRKVEELSLDSRIEENFVCSEKHREFFQSVIGKGFSFTVTFQQYLKRNPGKKYSDAVTEWYRIKEEKKRNKGNSVIDSQFEYNTYIREFFKDNNGMSLKEAIQCWNYKKSKEGNHRYEKTDLVIFNGRK
jgi:hypothetical protein